LDLAFHLIGEKKKKRKGTFFFLLNGRKKKVFPGKGGNLIPLEKSEVLFLQVKCERREENESTATIADFVRRTGGAMAIGRGGEKKKIGFGEKEELRNGRPPSKSWKKEKRGDRITAREEKGKRVEVSVFDARPLIPRKGMCQKISCWKKKGGETNSSVPKGLLPARTRNLKNYPDGGWGGGGGGVGGGGWGGGGGGVT